jgi:hypothetical protein
MLQAPGTKRSKLKYDKLLSNIAFKFNLHRYSMELLYDEFTAVLKAGQRYFKPVDTRVEAPAPGFSWFRVLKLEYDELLSNFAFNFNVHRYMKVPHADAFAMLPEGFHDVVFTGRGLHSFLFQLDLSFSVHGITLIDS